MLVLDVAKNSSHKQPKGTESALTEPVMAKTKLAETKRFTLTC